MLANTRSRTVFGLQHKYSNEYFERSSGSPLGCFEAQILGTRQGGSPMIKRKSSVGRLQIVDSDGAAAKTLMCCSHPCSNLDNRSLRNPASTAESSESWPSGRLATSGHLAGALRSSNLRRTGLPAAKDLNRGWPISSDRWPLDNRPVSASDVTTPALDLDCGVRPSTEAANDALSPQAVRQLLQAALADGPQGPQRSKATEMMAKDLAAK